jgi:hypothetical protein
MKQLSILLLLVTIRLVTFGQVYQEMPQYGYRANRMAFDSTLQIPTTCGVPTLRSNVTKKSAIAFDSCNNKLYRYNPKTLTWAEVSGGGGTATFANNIVLNGSASNRLGVWVNGETIPVAGMALDSAFKVITQKAVAPTYVQPTTTIVAFSPNTYEIGTNLGTLTLSSTFTQNDAGALQSTLYYKDNVALGGNTTTISSLTSQVNFKVSKTYAQGACKNNNLGVEDCTGRVQAGTITSGFTYITPFPKSYLGYSSNAIPTSANIIASLGGNNFFSTSRDISNESIVVTGTDRYGYYAYPSSFGELTSIIVSGLESILAFNLNVVSVTNAQGYVQNYNVYTTKNKFNNTTITINSAF